MTSWKSLKRGILRLQLLCVLIVICSVNVLQQPLPSLSRAKNYLYVREQKPNRSYEIDLWNRYVKNQLASPYCAAFVSYVTDGKPVKSGLARDHAKGRFRTIGEVLKRKYVVKPGDKVIWARGTTTKGHIGLVDAWKYDRGYTVEANTSSGSKGSQFDGSGVYIRFRIIQPYNFFRIIGFVEM